MCLVMPELNIGTACKDITCYKLFYKQKGYKRLSTIFQSYPMTIGKTYKIKPSEYPVYSNGTCAAKNLKQYYIEKGCFHSFKTIQGARAYLKKIEKNYDPCYVIVKCVVPTGSEYYEGEFDAHYKSYASTRIQPIEIVK